MKSLQPKNKMKCLITFWEIDTVDSEAVPDNASAVFEESNKPDGSDGSDESDWDVESDDSQSDQEPEYYLQQRWDEFTFDTQSEHTLMEHNGRKYAVYPLDVAWPVPPTGAVVFEIGGDSSMIRYSTPTAAKTVDTRKLPPAEHLATLPQTLQITLDNPSKQLTILLTRVDPDEAYQQYVEARGTTMGYYYLYAPCQIWVTCDENV